jgi:hypothetical protein
MGIRLRKRSNMRRPVGNENNAQKVLSKTENRNGEERVGGTCRGAGWV